MKCPLSNSMVTDKPGELAFAFRDCLKEECAWWDDEMEYCSMQGIGATLEHIALSLRDSVQKMPHEQQFRK